MRCKPKSAIKSMSFQAFIRLIAATIPFIFAPLTAHAATASTPWPIAIREQIARIGAAQYALRKSARQLCESNNTASGIKIDYIDAYAPNDQSLVRELTGLADAPEIIAVAPGSPAQAAGIRPGDNIVAVNHTPVSELRAQTADTSLFADTLEERLAATPEGQDIDLKLERDGRTFDVAFRGEQLCATRFILKTDEGITAYSDGKNVALSSKLVEFAQNEDELAVFASHELAHIIARDGKAKSLGQRRAMEDRADVLGADLMRCAGFDVERGLDIWRRYNKRDWLRWFRDPSHRNTPDRIRRIEAHIAAVPKTCPPAIPALAD